MNLDLFYHCQRKQVYYSLFEATRQAYILSENRRKEYEPYTCRYCYWYHIGRKEHYRYRIKMKHKLCQTCKGIGKVPTGDCFCGSGEGCTFHNEMAISLWGDICPVCNGTGIDKSEPNG